MDASFSFVLISHTFHIEDLLAILEAILDNRLKITQLVLHISRNPLGVFPFLKKSVDRSRSLRNEWVTNFFGCLDTGIESSIRFA